MKRAMKTCISILLSFCLLLTLLPAAFAEEAGLDAAVNEVTLFLGDEPPEEPPQFIDEGAPEAAPESIDDNVPEEVSLTLGDDTPVPSDSALQTDSEDAPENYIESEITEPVPADMEVSANAVEAELAETVEKSKRDLKFVYRGTKATKTFDFTDQAYLSPADFDLDLTNVAEGDANKIGIEKVEAKYDGTDAGDHNVTVNFTISQAGTSYTYVPQPLTISGLIEPLDIGYARSEIPDQDYKDGAAIEPNVRLYYDPYHNNTVRYELKNTDFNVKSYENNTEITTGGSPARVDIEGIGNFTGTRIFYFNIIDKAETRELKFRVVNTEHTKKEFDMTTDTLLTVEDFEILPETIAEGDVVTITAVQSKYTSALRGYHPIQCMLTVDTSKASHTYTCENYTYGDGYIDRFNFNSDNVDFKTISEIKLSEVDSEEAITKKVEEATTVKIKSSGYTLVNGTDYKISGYRTNYNSKSLAGDYSYGIQGMGSFEYSEGGNFTVKVIDDRTDISDWKIDPIEPMEYTGEPRVLTEFSLSDDSGKVLVEGTDYELSYKNNIYVGTATLTITGKGNYTGEKTINFKIVQSAKEDRSVKITLISGHEPKKTYDGTANCGYYTGTAATGDQAYHPLLSHSDFNVEGVASGDTVIVDDNYLRTLKFDGRDAGNRTVSVNLANHIQVTSSQNTYTVSPDSVTTIRGTINRKTLNVMPNPAEQTAVYGSTYTIKASVTGLLTGDSISGKLGPETTVDVGKHAITVGTLAVRPDNYEIKVGTGNLTITPKPINATDVAVSSIANQNYTGSAITPSVTIRYGAVTLTKDKDYTLTYANNTNAGTATVTITGKGNYSGTRIMSFQIIRTSSGSSTRTDPIWIVAPHGGSIEVNETISLQGFINDAYPKISRKNWTWASSNAEVATVTGTDMAALVTGRKAGTTTITASTPDRSYIATCVVKVVKPQAAASVRINSGGVSAIGVKAKLQLTAEISPSGASMPKLKWQTSNSSIATVSSKGLVTGKKAGRVKIRVKTSTGLSDIIRLEVREDTTLRKVTISTPGTTTIGINGTLQLTAIPEPASAVYRMKWQTSNKSIATVSSKGLVTGKKAGRVKIRVITDNGLSDIITLQVADAKLPSKVGIKPSAPQLLGIGKTLRLTARFKPSDAVSMLKWTSSNEKVASVDAKGVVTGISAGSATISVRTENKLTASVKIQVRDPYEPLSIAIKPSQLTALSVNDKLQIKTKMTAIDKAKTRLTWKSSNTKVATVNSEGLVTAKKAGKVTITVTTHNGLSASVKIIVK